MRFVEDKERQLADRERRIQNDWELLVGEKRGPWRGASGRSTPAPGAPAMTGMHQREEFFQRLHDDIDRRRR